MGRQSELNKEIVGVEGGGGGEGSVSLGDEGSVLLLFAPKLIAEQVLFLFFCFFFYFYFYFYFYFIFY